MDRKHTVIDIFELDQNTTVHENMNEYVTEKHGCLTSYYDEHDYVKIYKDASDYLTRWRPIDVLERSNQGDPEAILELALRSVSFIIIPCSRVE